MLDAVLAIVAESGLAAVTVGAVAERSGISNGSLYYRFRSRASLVEAAQAQFLEGVETEFRRRLDAARDIPEDEAALSAVAEYFVTPFEKNRALFRAFLIEGNDVPELRRRGSESSQRFVAWTTEFLGTRMTCSPARVAALAHLLDAVAVRGMIGDGAEAADRDELTSVLTALLRSYAD